MSAEMLAAYRAAREALLEAQRDCAYCGKRCEDADHLYMHIVIRHDTRTATPA